MTHEHKQGHNDTFPMIYRKQNGEK